MKLFMNMPPRMLGLLTPGNPGNDGFLESLKGPLLIVAVAIGLALIIALVILTTHRGGAGKRSKRDRSARLSSSKSMAPGEEGARRKKRRRHKRHRRDHRKRNPTLSETGGMPPTKNDIPEEEETEPDQ